MATLGAAAFFPATFMFDTLLGQRSGNQLFRENKRVGSIRVVMLFRADNLVPMPLVELYPREIGHHGLEIYGFDLRGAKALFRLRYQPRSNPSPARISHHVNCHDVASFLRLGLGNEKS